MTKKAPSHIETELAKFTITDAAIATMAEKYMPLSINGLDDKDGYDKVHAARMVVKGKRVEIEKIRKELKKDALAFGKAVDGEAKRITALLEGIEGHLSDQQSAVDDEKERIKREKIEAIQAEQERKEQEERDLIAKQEEAAKLAREKVMAEEEARLKAERERQKKVEAEQRKKEVALKTAQEKVEAEQRALLEAKEKAIADNERSAELEAAKKKAAKDAITEAKKKEEKAKAAAERREELKPDKEKLVALAEAIGSFPLPTVKDAMAKSILGEVGNQLQNTVNFIREFTDAE
jgi:DNA repair exonuclease SbcCD ATPase subunit